MPSPLLFLGRRFRKLWAAEWGHLRFRAGIAKAAGSGYNSGDDAPLFSGPAFETGISPRQKMAVTKAVAKDRAERISG